MYIGKYICIYLYIYTYLYKYKKLERINMTNIRKICYEF